MILLRFLPADPDLLQPDEVAEPSPPPALVAASHAYSAASSTRPLNPSHSTSYFSLALSLLLHAGLILLALLLPASLFISPSLEISSTPTRMSLTDSAPVSPLPLSSFPSEPPPDVPSPPPDPALADLFPVSTSSSAPLSDPSPDTSASSPAPAFPNIADLLVSSPSSSGTSSSDSASAGSGSPTSASPSSLPDSPATSSPPPVPRPVSFSGLSSPASSNIVYIVDASGSMITSLPFIITELQRSISALAPDQRFRVIFFQRNNALLVPGPSESSPPALPARLLAASASNRQFVSDWIQLDRSNIRAQGRSNPLAALSLALSNLDPAPDLIFLLSSDITGVGEFEISQAELLKTIERLNRNPDGSRKALIRTIQFLDPDPLETLRKIAQRNGGPDGYRFVDRAALDAFEQSR